MAFSHLSTGPNTTKINWFSTTSKFSILRWEITCPIFLQHRNQQRMMLWSTSSLQLVLEKTFLVNDWLVILVYQLMQSCCVFMQLMSAVTKFMIIMMFQYWWLKTLQTAFYCTLVKHCELVKVQSLKTQFVPCQLIDGWSDNSTSVSDCHWVIFYGARLIILI